MKNKREKLTLRNGMIKISGLSHKRQKSNQTQASLVDFKNIYIMYNEIKKNKKGIISCLSQECNNMNRARNKITKLKTHGIEQKKINICYKI